MVSDHDCNNTNKIDNSDIGINSNDDDKSGIDDDISDSSSSASLSDADESSDDTNKSTSDGENNNSQCVVEQKINDDEYCELLQDEYIQLKNEIQIMKEKHKIILLQHDDLSAEQKTLQQQKINNDTFQELSYEFLELHQQLIQIKDIKENNIKILNELQHELESSYEEDTTSPIART